MRGVFARSITARVRYADDRTESRTAHLAEPSALTEVLQSAAADLVERIDRPGHLVRAVGFSCSGLLDGAGAPALFPLVSITLDDFGSVRIRFASCRQARKAPQARKSARDTRAIMRRLEAQHPNADTELHYGIL